MVKEKYEGIRSGSFAERAIDFVMEVKSISGTRLADHLGTTVSNLKNVRRAVDLGFLQIAKSERNRHNRWLNVYTLGEKFEEHEYGALCGVTPATVKPDAEPEAPALVQPRAAPVFRSLNLAAILRLPHREGAWDFRNIPSVYARAGK